MRKTDENGNVDTKVISSVRPSLNMQRARRERRADRIKQHEKFASHPINECSRVNRMKVQQMNSVVSSTIF